MSDDRKRRVLVTGPRGMLGWHLRCRLADEPGVVVDGADRHVVGDEQSLADKVEGADVIVHFAGINRGTDADVEDGNPAVAEALVRALERTKSTATVIYSSSIHAAGDTPYGRSKRRAGEILEGWAQRSGGALVTLVLPHVFGESARPFYNSVVATFCHQLAEGEQPEVMNDAELHLLHAQDVADLVAGTLDARESGEIKPPGEAIHVSKLLAQLTRIDERYRAHAELPDLTGDLDLALFNTYRSFLYPRHYPMDLVVRQDERGELFETVKSHNGGQTFLSRTHPGITRGNHYHRRKVERFVVLEGDAEIRLRRLFDDDVVCFRVSGNRPQIVDIPTLHTHNIENVGSGTLLTLFWAHEFFDPERPDTLSLQV